MFLNRRSTSVLVLIFEVLAVIVVVGILFAGTAAYATSGGIVGIRANNELYLLLNALIAVPGDVHLEFPQDLSSYRVELQDSAVVTTLIEEGQKTREAKKILRLPEGYTLSGAVEGESRICLEKKGQHLLLLPCPEEPAKDGEQQKAEDT